MTGDYTILAAVLAGLVSFISPCVLPLVPAYLGQLTAVAVAAQGPGATPSRWTAVRHSLLYVAGFGGVFTLLGLTATFAGGALADYMFVKLGNDLARREFVERDVLFFGRCW